MEAVGRCQAYHKQEYEKIKIKELHKKKFNAIKPMQLIYQN